MIRYEHARSVTPEAFVDLLRRSGLAERRPMDDADVDLRLQSKTPRSLAAGR